MPKRDISGAKLTRILTYNVHSCIGTDRRLSVERIASVIASHEPDIVALQELDVGRKRTGGIDQAQAIADQLGMFMHFHPAMRVMEERYGDAILTPRKSRLVKAEALPGFARRRGLEPRGALWATVEVDGAQLQVINTHLGLHRHERLNQLDALLGPEWLGHPDCREPLILAGDFNANSTSQVYRRLTARLRDAQCAHAQPGRRASFPASLPVLRLDYVFVSAGIEILATRVVRDREARIASDHLPIVVDFELRPTGMCRLR